jgi:hypothetical protein
MKLTEFYMNANTLTAHKEIYIDSREKPTTEKERMK